MRTEAMDNKLTNLNTFMSPFPQSPAPQRLPNLAFAKKLWIWSEVWNSKVYVDPKELYR